MMRGMAKRRRMGRDLWVPLVAGGAALLVLGIAERRRPLRQTREPLAERTARNLAMAGLSAVASNVLEQMLVAPLIRRVEKRRVGLLQRLPLPHALRIVAGVLLLDYTLWWWHWMNHRVPFLWRFHLVHHVDRDLDASTAVRFHFGEMSLSVLFRAAQVCLLGIDRRALEIWTTLLMPSILFQHSNLRLDGEWESVLVRWIVTPRMHGIHHSDYRDETDSNWSSLFSCWDSLHGTLRLNVPQDEVCIGVPAYQNRDDVVLPTILVMPFGPQCDDWVSAAGIEKLTRPGLRTDAGALAE